MWLGTFYHLRIAKGFGGPHSVFVACAQRWYRQGWLLAGAVKTVKVVRL